MDEAKKKELEERIKDCDMKIANESAKKIRYESQLRNDKVKFTKSRPKTGQKQSESIPKTEQKQETEKVKTSFYDDFVN